MDSSVRPAAVAVWPPDDGGRSADADGHDDAALHRRR